MFNRIIFIFIMAITISCQKNTSQEINNSIENTSDEQFLILDKNKDTSTIATESINLGLVSSTTPLSPNKTITVTNQSTANITFNFSDLESKLLLNQRFSIISNACKIAGSLKSGKSCSIIFALTYQPTEDYSEVISSQIVPYPNNLLYSKINLSGNISLPPALRQINTVFEITPVASQNYLLSPQKLIQTNTFTLTNISSKTIALATNAPLIILPAGNGGVISRNGCIAGSTPVLLKINAFCTFDIKYEYDAAPAKASFIDPLTLSSTNPKIDASSYSLPINVVNNTPSLTPPNILQFSQSKIITVLTNGVSLTKLTITNISGKNGIPSATTNPTLLTIPDPFLLGTTNCGSILKPANSCEYNLKIDPTKTVNMIFVERIINTIGSAGFIYAGNSAPVISENRIACIVGYAPSIDGLSCIVSNEPVLKNITINKKIGSQILNNGTATAASDGSLKILNTITSTMIKNDACLKSSATCSTSFMSTDISNNVNLYLQYMADQSAISPGYRFKNFDNNGVIVPSPIGNGNQLELKTLAVQDYTLNITYEPICTVSASQVATVLAPGVIQSNVIDYKLNPVGSQCIIKSCNIGYSVDLGGLNCVQDVVSNRTLIIKKMPLNLALKADAGYLITKVPALPISGSVLKSEGSKSILVEDGSSVVINNSMIDPGYKIKSIYSELPSMACLTAVSNDSCTINSISANETVIVEVEPIDITLNLAVNIVGATTESAINIPDLTKIHVDSIADINTVLNDSKVLPACIDGSGSMANGSCAKQSDIYEFVNWTYSSGIIPAVNPNIAAQSIGFDASSLVVTATANYRLKNTLYNDLVLNNKYEIYPFGTTGTQFDLDSQYYFPTKREQNPNGSISGYFITSIKKGSAQSEVLSSITVICLNSSNVPTKYYGNTSLTSFGGTLLSGITHIATMSDSADLKACNQIVSIFPESADDTIRSDSFVITTKMTSSLIDPQTSQPFELIQTLNMNINSNNDILPNVSFKDNLTNNQIINNHFSARPKNLRTMNSINLTALYGGTNVGLVSNIEEGHRPEMFIVPAIADNTNVKIDMNVSSLEAAHSNKQYSGSIRVMDQRNTSCRYVNNQSMVLGDVSNYSTNYIVRTARANVIQDAGACPTIDTGFTSPLLPERYDFIGNDNFTCDANEYCFDNNSARTYLIRAKALSSDREATFVSQVMRVETELSGSNPKLAIATTVKDSTGSMVADSGNKVKKNDPVNFTAVNENGAGLIENCGAGNADCQFKITVFKETENNLTWTDFDFFNKNIVFETSLSSNVTHSFTPTATGVYNVLMISYNTVSKRTARSLTSISVQNNYHDADGMAALVYLVETLPANQGYKIYLDNDYSDPLNYSNADVGFWGFSLSKLTALDKTTAIRYFSDQYAPEVVLVGAKVAIIQLPNVNTTEYESLVKMHYKNPGATSANDDSAFYQFIKIHKCSNASTPIYDPNTATCVANPCGAGTIAIASPGSLAGQVSEVLSLGSGGFECQ